jgi:hypothetical protein
MQERYFLACKGTSYTQRLLFRRAQDTLDTVIFSFVVYSYVFTFNLILSFFLSVFFYYLALSLHMIILLLLIFFFKDLIFWFR